MRIWAIDQVVLRESIAASGEHDGLNKPEWCPLNELEINSIQTNGYYQAEAWEAVKALAEGKEVICVQGSLVEHFDKSKWQTPQNLSIDYLIRGVWYISGEGKLETENL